MDPKALLKQYWGYENFRPPQEDIIRSVIAGRDTVALMPTGGGKSLCYQIPALALPGLTLVISPLISLMRDQVSRLQQLGIKAEAVHSGHSFARTDYILNQAMAGAYRLLYVAPERLLGELMQQRGPLMNITLLAVDEAHCISQWGYDFRPSYLQIARFRQLLTRVPVLALTATATNEVLADLMEKLQLQEPQVFRTSFFRENLSYSVLFEENKPSRLKAMLEKSRGTALVYVRSRHRTQQIARYLLSSGVAADAYHAGLPHATRQKRQQLWMKGQLRVMVCTNAFGMGIDKPDVRLVVHWDLPENLENYFQEAGRAGRDGKRAHAVLLYNYSDLLDLEQRMRMAVPQPGQIRQVYQALANFFGLAIGAGQGCTFPFDLARFSKNFRLPPLLVLNALKVLEQQEYLTTTEAVHLPASVTMRMQRQALYRYEMENPGMVSLLHALLRFYPGIFDQEVYISEDELALHLKTSRSAVVSQLRLLHEQQVINYRTASDEPLITFMQPRHDSRHLPLDLERLSHRRRRHTDGLKAIIRYVTGQDLCRSVVLLQYFGEHNSRPCGICDVCLQRNRLPDSVGELNALRQQLVSSLQQKAHSLHELVRQAAPHRPDAALLVIRQLLDSGAICYDGDNRLTLAS